MIQRRIILTPRDKRTLKGNRIGDVRVAIPATRAYNLGRRWASPREYRWALAFQQRLEEWRNRH